MASFTISLSKEHQQFIAGRMAAEGISSVSKYIDTLLRAERRRKAEERLLRLVEEAEASGPATPMTKADWDRLKRGVWERDARARGATRGHRRQKTRRHAGSR